MLCYPEDIYEKLEFDKILNRLSSYCFGAPAKKLILGMKAYASKVKIERMLDEVQEFQKSMDLGYSFPISHYESIAQEIALLAKVDYVLELEQYLNIYVHIQTISEIKNFFASKSKDEELPLLFTISEQIDIDPKLVKAFERIFSEDGKMKHTASSELSRIFKYINSKERELSKVFVQAIERYKTLGYLTDNYESVKNSRRVLSVNAENKRRIKGIIHDESATGKTVFIEPEEILEINNDLFDLETQKRQEIYKILKALSAELRPYLSEFDLWQKIIVRYDIIRSKALFALSYNGKRPNISDGELIQLKQAYHPLLYLIHQSSNKAIVPFDLSLDRNNRMLVISGPNAGGKSVTLKAVGLNQLMLQSGLLVPVGDDSSFVIFQNIMIDIGDQQSLEGDLSTYSSRLIHMNKFVEISNKKSIVLIDEFGSGSDPKMGGAIAEAVLHKLVNMKCYGLITTHYSNIKNYAFRSEHILNGAMLFDREALKPSYQLKVGQPGSSFAFELAKQIGMDKEVLDFARKRAGKDSETVDKLLIDLQSEKKVLDDQLFKTLDEQRRLKQLISSYERMKDELDIRRKKLKKEAKEKSYFEISNAEKEIQKWIKEAKKDKKELDLKNLVNKVKEEKEKARSEIKELSNTIFNEELQKVKDIEVGQFVKLKSGGQAAKVIDFDEKKVKLEMGILNIEVPRSEVFMVNEPIVTKHRSINTNTISNPYSLEHELDIRGYSKSEAMASVQEFLDNALMGSASRLKIMHGKGSGVLKKVVWGKAKEYKDISKIWHPEEEFGGTGVSFISF